MKRTIVICEYISTGINYIEDVLARGYEPVLLEGHYIGTKEEVAQIKAVRDQLNASFKGRYKIIKESDDYQKILRQVKEVNPLLVIPGGEFGVTLATRLTEDLGLPGNPYSQIKAMTEKDAMHEALRSKGLRYIRGRIVKSIEEADDFYDELGVEDVVVKRSHGGGTQGVFLCHGKEKMLEAARKSFSAKAKDECGKKNIEILIQEQIKGTEYIVNTLSCGGKHRISSVWVYDKIKLSNGCNAYNYAMSLPRIEPGLSRLLRYALKAVDAVGIKYGPVHGEYIVDENGPVLIEVNCRPMGAALQREYTERIWGHHETDTALDSYLDPQKFEEDSHHPYKINEFGAIKLFILPENTEVMSAPIMQIAMHLKSYYKSHYSDIGRNDMLHKTSDLGTAGGVVYLVNKNEELVKSDCEILHLIEMKYPRILFQGSDYNERFNSAVRDIPSIIKNARCYGSNLIFSDTENEEIKGATTVSSSDLPSCYNSYEQGILDISKAETYADLESIIQQIFLFFSKVRIGGRIIVPESTWCHLPYTIEGMEILMRTAGLKIELPPANMPDLLIATV